MWCYGLEKWKVKITPMYEGSKFKSRLLCNELRWEGVERIESNKKTRRCDNVNVWLINQGQ
jgi:hypothetical protein